MELTEYDVTTRHKVVATVEDGIVVESVHGKDMKITHVIMEYRVEDGQWVCDRVDALGLRIKLDKSVGQRTDDTTYRLRHDGVPAWVLKAAEHYRPKEAPPLPAVPTCVLDTEEKET